MGLPEKSANRLQLPQGRPDRQTDRSRHRLDDGLGHRDRADGAVVLPTANLVLRATMYFRVDEYLCRSRTDVRGIGF
jgi:hypothetical protein